MPCSLFMGVKQTRQLNYPGLTTQACRTTFCILANFELHDTACSVPVAVGGELMLPCGVMMAQDVTLIAPLLCV